MRRTGLKEIRILEKLNASDPEGRYNCIKLLGHFEDRHHLCLVFEPMDLNLRQVLKKYGNNIGLSIRAVRVYAYKLLRALLLLKRNNLIHADFKPDNILVNTDRTVLKLADFGSAFENSNELELTPYLVSRFYRAPEIILGLQYSFPIDMFSLGTCLYEFACGRPMFLSRNNNHHIKLIMDVKGNFPKRMLQKAKFRNLHFNDEFRFKERINDPVTKKVTLSHPQSNCSLCIVVFLFD
jgi:serine/threonine-protein kinase PRP4